MITIMRNGKITVITEWREWLIWAVAVVVMTAVLGAVAFLVLGIAVSIVGLLVNLLPAIAMLGWFIQPRRHQI
jgi:uncharacterized membrane protein